MQKDFKIVSENIFLRFSQFLLTNYYINLYVFSTIFLLVVLKILLSYFISQESSLVHLNLSTPSMIILQRRQLLYPRRRKKSCQRDLKNNKNVEVYRNGEGNSISSRWNIRISCNAIS